MRGGWIASAEYIVLIPKVFPIPKGAPTIAELVPQRNVLCPSASVGNGHARQSLPLRRQRDEITLQPCAETG